MTGAGLRVLSDYHTCMLVRACAREIIQRLACRHFQQVWSDFLGLYRKFDVDEGAKLGFKARFERFLSGRVLVGTLIGAYDPAIKTYSFIKSFDLYCCECFSKM